MRYIEAPARYKEKNKSIFLAGGISGCSNWQKELINLLKYEDIILLNPRREHYPFGNPDAVKEQITWEFNHLKKADVVSFWFPKETLCPITLYELGACLKTDKQIFIGIHPEYQRKQDIEIQTKLIMPEIEIVYSLKRLSDKIKDNVNNKT